MFVGVNYISEVVVWFGGFLSSLVSQAWQRRAAEAERLHQQRERHARTQVGFWHRDLVIEPVEMMTGWWFQRFFYFHPLFGEDSHFD